MRRNPLVILLCLELMLNAGNLALVAFARAHGNQGGQIFALIVMVVAACEVAVGLGLVVASSGGGCRSTWTSCGSCRVEHLRGGSCWPSRSRGSSSSRADLAAAAAALHGVIGTLAIVLSFAVRGRHVLQAPGRAEDAKQVVSSAGTTR